MMMQVSSGPILLLGTRREPLQLKPQALNQLMGTDGPVVGADGPVVGTEGPVRSRWMGPLNRQICLYLQRFPLWLSLSGYARLS